MPCLRPFSSNNSDAKMAAPMSTIGTNYQRPLLADIGRADAMPSIPLAPLHGEPLMSPLSRRSPVPTLLPGCKSFLPSGISATVARTPSLVVVAGIACI